LLELCQNDLDKDDIHRSIKELDHEWSDIKLKLDNCQLELETSMTKSIEFNKKLDNVSIWFDNIEQLAPFLRQDDESQLIVDESFEQIRTAKDHLDCKYLDIIHLQQDYTDILQKRSDDDYLPEIQMKQENIIHEQLSSIDAKWNQINEQIQERKTLLYETALNNQRISLVINDIYSSLTDCDSKVSKIGANGIVGDVKKLEMDISKLKMLINDIELISYDIEQLKETVNLSQNDNRHENIDDIQQSIVDITRKWDTLLKRSIEKYRLLELYLQQIQSIRDNLELLDKDLDNLNKRIVGFHLNAVGYETKNQNDKFNDLCLELSSNEQRLEKLFEQINLIKNDNNENNLTILTNLYEQLKLKFDQVQQNTLKKGQDITEISKSIELFHITLQKFIAWLTDTERQLNNLNPVCRGILPTILKQIDDHDQFQQMLNEYKEYLLNLQKLGTHLKFTCPKQDCTLVKNLLLSVQQRWDKIIVRSKERTRELNKAYQEAKQFNNDCQELEQWFDLSIEKLAEQSTNKNENGELKQQLLKHKEFSRLLGTKQIPYDHIQRQGKKLMEISNRDNDRAKLNELCKRLKDKWAKLCTMSLERQRYIEHSLLLCGQCNDALQSLIEWLSSIEQSLRNDRVYGDIDTVINEIELHNIIENEFDIRTSEIESIKVTVRRLVSSSYDDAQSAEQQLLNLDHMWDEMYDLCKIKHDKLEIAYEYAQRFNKQTKELLDWIMKCEHYLKFTLSSGEITDYDQLNELNEKFEQYLQQYKEKEVSCIEIIELGQFILDKSHQDSILIIKQWLSVIKSRWMDLQRLTQQRKEKLKELKMNLDENENVINELNQWLEQINIPIDETEILPTISEQLNQLLDEQIRVNQNLYSRQNDIERLVQFYQPTNETLTTMPTTTTAYGKKVSKLKRPSARISALPQPTLITSPSQSNLSTTIQNPKVRTLVKKWTQLKTIGEQKQKRIQDAIEHEEALEQMQNFSFDKWRRRYIGWLRDNRARIMDIFRRLDRDRTGKISRDAFINGILQTNFETNRVEMEAVANHFYDKENFIDYREFFAALKPERELIRPVTDTERIKTEVNRQAALCQCSKKYEVQQVAEGRYRFGESQSLRLVRILRSTVMVRVGGGWTALDEFLVRHDPCRGMHVFNEFMETLAFTNANIPLTATAESSENLTGRLYYIQEDKETKGRTNYELHEHYSLRDGVSQTMSLFKPKIITIHRPSCILHPQQQQQLQARSAATTTPKSKDKSQRTSSTMSLNQDEVSSTASVDDLSSVASPDQTPIDQISDIDHSSSKQNGNNSSDGPNGVGGTLSHASSKDSILSEQSSNSTQRTSKLPVSINRLKKHSIPSSVTKP
ncbi:unnamed protein product, partial [Didymodactylos carnosus]